MSARRHERRSPSALAARVRRALMELTGGAGTVLSHKERAWSSITFVGTRHELVLRFVGDEEVEAGEALIDRLPEHEFALAGQLVAEAEVVESAHFFDADHERLTLRVVLLLLEES